MGVYLHELAITTTDTNALIVIIVKLQVCFRLCVTSVAAIDQIVRETKPIGLQTKKATTQPCKLPKNEHCTDKC